MASGGTELPAVQPTDAPEGSRRTPARGHFPGFEGLRALAATAVVVYHVVTNAGDDAPSWLRTPASVLDMGVSVFFVISGFLIYRPFVAAGAAGTRPLAAQAFWWRRLVRIVPAYWAALTAMWALGWVEVGEQPWRLYLFLQVYDAYTTLAGIVPAWSLNTEVAFYAFVPVWAWLVRRVVRRGAPPLAADGAGVAALVAGGYLSRALFSASDRVWAVGGDGQEVLMRHVSFSWLPNTIDLFALGMGLAVLSVWAAREPEVRARLDRWAAPAGAWWALAAATWLGFAHVWGEPELNGGYQGTYWQVRQAAFGLVAVALLVPAVFGDQQRGAVRAGLRARPVVWVGTVSYGLYLWHLDVLQELPGWLDRPFAEAPFALLLALTTALGLLAAAASWYGLERPLVVLRRLPGRTHAAPPDTAPADGATPGGADQGGGPGAAPPMREAGRQLT